MVFPQGVFSQESLAVLQQHQYLAAVNTDALPVDLEQEPLTVGEMWNIAILRYRGFPFFVRRYPIHGLENFAFDLLLGKPCLIVEHHAFFKGNGQHAIDFVKALNSLNCTLKWRGLGDVFKRSYQWRVGPDEITYIKMFANELLLSNESNEERFYQIEKADRGSTGVTQVSVNGDSIAWRRINDSIAFDCEVPPLAEASIRVQYRQAKPVTDENHNARVKIALRRYLSEFRDDFLSRHEGLLHLAQKTKGFLAGH